MPLVFTGKTTAEIASLHRFAAALSLRLTEKRARVGREARPPPRGPPSRPRPVDPGGMDQAGRPSGLSDERQGRVREVSGVSGFDAENEAEGMNRRREGGRSDPRRPPVGRSPSGLRADRAWLVGPVVVGAARGVGLRRKDYIPNIILAIRYNRRILDGRLPPRSDWASPRICSLWTGG